MFKESAGRRARVRTLLVALLATGAAGAALAQGAMCKEDVRVLAQPRDGLTLLEKYKDEFKALAGASFSIDNLNENDRRTKTRADASTVGKYHVYYVDEANVPLFAQSKWIVPLAKYYPVDYDYADFDPGRQKVATYAGEAWFAPLTGGGDLMVYRKDLLEKAGIKPPATLEEFVAAAKKLNDPANGVYGVALRGQRGSGANVWRWMPYFRGYGGQWFDGDKPVFDSPAALKATQTYLELFKYSAPGTKTGGWDEATGAFLAGKVALLVESTPLAGNALDPKMSTVIGKIALCDAASAADRRRLRPRPGDRRQGQQERGGEEVRRPLHRLGHLEEERAAPPRRGPVRRAEPHQRAGQSRVRQALRRRPRQGAGRHRQAHRGQLLAGPGLARPRRPLGDHPRGADHRFAHRHPGRPRRARRLRQTADRAAPQVSRPAPRSLRVPR